MIRITQVTKGEAKKFLSAAIPPLAHFKTSKVARI
jgi:hypothetical protein